MQAISNTQRDYELLVFLSSDTPKRDQFYVAEDVAVELFDGRVAIIRMGFVSDGHSTPAWLDSLLPHFDSRTNLAAIVHDYLYICWEEFDQHRELTNWADDRILWSERQYADLAYLKLMEQMAPGWWRNRLYYTAVRLFGWRNWNNYRAKAQK